MSDFKQLQRLMDIMAQLRDPDNGCPWDLEQDLKSLVPYTLEEAYELAEAIEHENEPDTVKELGDLLFHMVFYAQLGQEQGLFNLEKIAQVVSDKMIYRHPHVFSNHKYKDQQEFEKDWLKRKQMEKTTIPDEPKSLMDDVSTSLPAITRAIKLQKINSLISNKELAKKLGNNGYKRLTKHFNIKTIEQQTEQVYQFCLPKN